MRTPRVILDTNIMISGLVFLRGNEHKILRLVEDKEISLVLPEPILIETRDILETKFAGFEGLLEVFLENIEFQHMSLESILAVSSKYSDNVRDEKDLLIFASVALGLPDYFISGDRDLRVDLLRSSEISKTVTVFSSREFLSNFGK